MREILFKAKRLDNSEWVTGTYAFALSDIVMSLDDLKHGENNWIIEKNGYMHLIDTDTLCQYTGLTDKKGQKIWENDILQLLGEGAYKVIWNDMDAMFTFEDDYDMCTFDYYCSGNLEVIGNIFDNPELLKGEKA